MGDVEPKERTEEEQTPTEEPQDGEEKPVEEEGEDEGAEKPDEGEAKDEESEDDEKTKAKGEDAAAEPGEEKRKRAGGWQRKIERLERQNEMLLQQLTTHRPGQPPAAKPAEDKTPEEKAADYIDSLMEKRFAEREARKEQQTKAAEFQRRTAEVRAAHPDFDDVVMGADMPISPALEQALLTSEFGPAIMYQLARSPAELARISALPPLDAAREVGRLEARQTSSTASPQKPKPAFRPPAPPTSVNGSSSSTRSLDDLPLADYKRAYRSGRR